MQNPRRYAPMGGSFAPVWVAGFTWNGWQASAVYATKEKINAVIIQKLIEYCASDEGQITLMNIYTTMFDWVTVVVSTLSHLV